MNKNNLKLAYRLDNDLQVHTLLLECVLSPSNLKIYWGLNGFLYFIATCDGILSYILNKMNGAIAPLAIYQAHIHLCDWIPWIWKWNDLVYWDFFH